MILEYFSLGKGSITGPWERLEKFLPFYYRIITSYLKMSGMSCIPVQTWITSLIWLNIFIMKDRSVQKLAFIWNIKCNDISSGCQIFTLYRSNSLLLPPTFNRHPLYVLLSLCYLLTGIVTLYCDWNRLQNF